MKLRQLNNITVVTDLLRFAQVFSQMIHVGVDLDFSQVLNVLEASITELSKNKAKVQNPDLKDDIDQYAVSSMENTFIHFKLILYCASSYYVTHIETYFYLYLEIMSA